MRYETKQTILLIFLILDIAVLFFVLGLFFEDRIAEKLTNNKIETLYNNNISNCADLNFTEAIYCLNADFSSWFIYNLNNTGNFSLTEDELKIQGGVCSHASKWYIEKAESLGYQGQYINFYDKNNTIGHAIALLYDAKLNEYCVVDQSLIIGCATLQKN